MEFQTVVNRRRMIRTYDTNRSVPDEVIERIVHNAQRAPSAGFSQGTGLLVLSTEEENARFREAVTPEEDAENWFAAEERAPLTIVVLSNKDVYLDRYAEPDKGFTDRSDDWWTAPYWDIDAGMSALLILLTVVDEGLGACFFGMPINKVQNFRDAFGVPKEFYPIGAISIGYSDEPPRDLKARRKPATEVVRFGRWS